MDVKPQISEWNCFSALVQNANQRTYTITLPNHPFGILGQLKELINEFFGRIQ